MAGPEVKNECCEGCVIGNDRVRNLNLVALADNCSGSEKIDEVRRPDGTIQYVIASCPKFLGLSRAVLGEVINDPPLEHIVDDTQIQVGEQWLVAKLPD